MIAASEIGLWFGAMPVCALKAIDNVAIATVAEKLLFAFFPSTNRFHYRRRRRRIEFIEVHDDASFALFLSGASR